MALRVSFKRLEGRSGHMRFFIFLLVGEGGDLAELGHFQNKFETRAINVSLLFDDYRFN